MSEQAEVVPVPDEAAIERAAKWLFGENYVPSDRERAVAECWPIVSDDVRRVYRNRARAVLTAALE